MIDGDGWTRQVHLALDGDQAAWETIVESLSGVVWKTVNTYSLDPADREDVFASTFFRLFEKLGTIRNPRCLPGWVSTTARNEANAIWRSRQRTVPTEELPIQDLSLDTIDETLLDDELLGEVMRAFAALPGRAQALLRLMTAVPPLSYDEIAELLDMPRGSIGPTAGRNLAKLRHLLATYQTGEP
jgi:RNA polymerase sigma factor (sigma-70 family)